MKSLVIKIISIAAIILGLITVFHIIGTIIAENERLKSNQETLLAENQIMLAESQKYKAADSLNAIRVSQLELTLREYKKYRSEDLELIEQLKAGKDDLQKVITSQTETINMLSAKLNDSIKIDTTTNITDTLKCFVYKSKWTDVTGCINLRLDSIDMQIKNREALKVIETVTYKRFLGFLWKTSKIKNRQIDVVSENPNTQIVNCEYISIGQ